MSTIKDVAHLAGVSHGTVSNVINGAMGVSSENVRKVEDAIRVLGYQQDTKARSLKTNKTMNIGIVLPNIVDSSFSQLFTGIEGVLSEKQYTTSLYITSEVSAKERRILTRIQQQRMDGIIIATCQPNNKRIFEQLKNTGIKVVFVEREVEDSDFNFIAFNNNKAIYNTTLKLIEEGHKTIAIVSGPEEYSSEKEYLNGYKQALNENNISINNKLIEITNLDKESSFKATIRILQLGEIPDVILTTSTLLADGILKAISICEGNLPKKPLVVSVAGDAWTNVSNMKIQNIQRQFMLMGEKAAEILLSNIKNPAFHEVKRVILDDSSTVIENRITNSSINKSKKANNSLKVLMLDSSAAYATYALLADFRKKEGINVEIDILSLSELYEAIKDEALLSKYDVFEVDEPWLPEFAETGMLSDLSKYISDNPNTIDGLIPGILDVYAKYDNKFYVLPYMYGTQILFYRKDIFEDIRYQRMFYDEYHTELKPPKTWVEYNAIAKFFTKKYNPESPTFYGTTLGGRYYSGALCEFLPRKWAYGAKAFDENGDVVFNSKETVKALKNYCESYKYASPTSPEHWWGEQVEEFSQGEAAMMVLFMSHATDITDRTKSKVVGKIGYDIIPGRKPLLGGWSLGINANSNNKDQAFKFISWTCCKDTAIPYTILGGSTPCVNLYKSPELVSIYPWLPKSLQSLSISKKRQIPKSDSGKVISERRYEEIIGEAVYKAITEQMTPENAISKAAACLQELKIDK